MRRRSRFRCARAFGQPVRPEAEADEELKLLAIQGLQHSDPEQAVPMLEKILQGAQSPRLKERALFVLAQSNSPPRPPGDHHIAKGAGNPDLQRRAIQYLGANGTRENRELLAQIYSRRAMSTSSVASCGHSDVGRSRPRACRGQHGDVAGACAPRRCTSLASWAPTTSSGSSIRRRTPSTSRSASSRRCSSAATSRA